MTHLYVCHFSSGHIKVGRSTKPEARIRSHADRVSCLNVTLIESRIFECAGCVVQSERVLIDRCAAVAGATIKNEWFEGLDFGTACDMAAEAARLVAAPVAATAPVASYAFAEDVPRGDPRYVYDGEGWLDMRADEPHWPDSAVMRWDLRQNDWFKIWPELVSHPCALLFAPIHPDRAGAPAFADWVKSWPRSFDATELVASMPESGQEIVHLIWPELRKRKDAPAVKAEA